MLIFHFETKGPSYDPSELCERERIQGIRFKSTIQLQRKEGRKEKRREMSKKRGKKENRYKEGSEGGINN